MTDPRDPRVLEAVEKINRQPLPAMRVNYSVELGSWSGRVVPISALNIPTNPDEFMQMFESIKYTTITPDEILKMAKELK